MAHEKPSFYEPLKKHITEFRCLLVDISLMGPYPFLVKAAILMVYRAYVSRLVSVSVLESAGSSLFA